MLKHEIVRKSISYIYTYKIATTRLVLDLKPMPERFIAFILTVFILKISTALFKNQNTGM